VYPATVAPSPVEVRTIALAGLSDAGLEELSRKRLLFLSLDEMKAIRRYYAGEAKGTGRRKKGLPDDPTDVELEMIAQTWSEHCKHKIFAARIDYSGDGRRETIDSLFATYIKKTTETLAEKRGDLKSVFHDNSGVVDFDGEYVVCIKAETHNSPSALDPYGGAITGIVGVNRDILGTGIGARPIFNTNVLCFGEPSARREDVPKGLLHPRRVLAGVHHGIVDGGNQSGIPVAAGGFLFDESYTGKPLVFCGTAGILPARINGRNSWEKRIEPGDLAVMAGGRIGKDGIHGATFSSAALDEASPTSAVQIGDPITQKKLADFLLEARDLDLYKGITDNGAGGLSSSLGEMAQHSGGIRILLEKCPLKYSGLAPWEILVSESQERMSLSVAPGKIGEFLALARRRGVEAAVVGEFTDSGRVDVLYEDRHVGSLSMDFLHDGLPKMRLRAEWKAPVLPAADPGGPDPKDALLGLLAEPNIASKEPLIRQYDHEVQAGSVIKPFAGTRADGPTDGGVFRPRFDSDRGLTITHGICPRMSAIDAYDMAVLAVDEAYRAHIALGGEPDMASALDNFCWPDPVESPDTPDGAYKLAGLVRACWGLRDACLAYNLPLVSGKDSMKNDARIGGRKVSVKPTLLVTVMGIISDCRRALTTDFKAPGGLIYLLGESDGALGGSCYEKILRRPLGPGPKADLAAASSMYRKFHEAAAAGLAATCHDVSDGGLAVALAESCLGGRLGAVIDADGLPGGLQGILFGEGPSRFVVEVKPENAGAFERVMAGSACRKIGSVSADDVLVIRRGGAEILRAGLDEIETAWKSFAKELLS
jgi:phosphoribosylformylglycinamidine synthase